MQFARIARLLVHAGLVAVVAESRRRNLPARVAVDATGIDVKFAFHILRQPLVHLRHGTLDSAGVVTTPTKENPWRLSFPCARNHNVSCQAQRPSRNPPEINMPALAGSVHLDGWPQGGR